MMMLASRRLMLSMHHTSRGMSSLAKYVEDAGLEKNIPSEKDSAVPWSVKVILDGNLAETVVSQGPGATLVGRDGFGNSCFEKVDAQSNRNRWVVFAGSAHHYGNQNPTVVPPEWHGWLHYTTDENPVNSPDGFKQPQYHLEAKIHPSFGGVKYQPKGARGTLPRQRNWRKYEPWTPPEAFSSRQG